MAAGEGGEQVHPRSGVCVWEPLKGLSLGDHTDSCSWLPSSESSLLKFPAGAWNSDLFADVLLPPCARGRWGLSPCPATPCYTLDSWRTAPPRDTGCRQCRGRVAWAQDDLDEPAVHCLCCGAGQAEPVLASWTQDRFPLGVTGRHVWAEHLSVSCLSSSEPLLVSHAGGHVNYVLLKIWVEIESRLFGYRFS